MTDTTTVRIHKSTAADVRALADEDGATINDTIGKLVRAERQRRMGRALASADIDGDDTAWLDLGASTVTDVDARR